MYQYWVYYRCTYTYLLHKKHITSLASCLAMPVFEATAARKEAAFRADEEHGRGSPENRCAGNIRKSPSEFETSGSYYWVIPLCTIPWLVYTFIIIYIYVIYYICMLYNIVYIYILISLYYTIIMTLQLPSFSHMQRLPTADCGILVGAREQWCEIRERV